MDFQALRHKMVEEQLKARGIGDAAVLGAMERVPRHKFIPDTLKSMAYDDCPVPIGEGQTVSQPYIVALMTQCLGLNKEKRVLEVGTGSGYQAAILAELSREVYSVERIEALAERARWMFQNLKYKNIKVFSGDGSLGLPDESQPFDAVIVTAASPRPPEHLFEQLSSGGRLVVPVGGRFSQTLTLFTKVDDQITEEVLCGCVFVPLIGKYGWPLN